jgi:hypothetical protein
MNSKHYSLLKETLKSYILGSGKSIYTISLNQLMEMSDNVLDKNYVEITSKVVKPKETQQPQQPQQPQQQEPEHHQEHHEETIELKPISKKNIIELMESNLKYKDDKKFAESEFTLWVKPISAN